MASSNRGIMALLAIGLAGGLGFAFFYFKVLVPGNERKEARAQIEEWADKRWRPLRSCLVGAAPRAAGGRDALFLRAALTTGSLPSSKDCARFFVDLRRPGTAGSGDQDIELHWRSLEGKTALLANAYLDVDYDRAASIKKVGEGIDGVDTAYDALREVAGLDPDPPQGPGPFPALPAGTALAGTEGLVVARVMIAGDAVLGQAIRDDDTGAYLTVRSPTDVRIEGAPSGNVRMAAGDVTWALWLDVSPAGDATLGAGFVDAAMVPRRDISTVLATTKAGLGLVAPVFALGKRPVWIAVYEMNVGAGPALWIARSLDSGTTFADKRELRGDDAGIAFRPSLGQERFDVFWRSPLGINWLGLGTHDATAPLDAQIVFAQPSADPARVLTCHAGAADWFLLDGAVARAVAGGKDVPTVGRVDRIAELLACDVEHLVVRQPERNEVVVCDLQGCKTALRARPGPGSNLPATWGAKSGLVAATTSGDLVLVWRGAEPQILRMPGADRSLHAVVEWNGSVHLLFEIIERGLEVVRLP